MDGGARQLDELLSLLEQRLADVEALPESVREQVFELLDGIDALHRAALHRLAERVGEEAIAEARADPAVGWLLEAYGVGVDAEEVVEAVLDEVRPYVHSHGGDVQLVGVADGVVRVRLSGSCSGCTASAVTVREGIEAALREHLPGFVAVEAEEEGDATPHPPPVPVQLSPRRP